MNTKRIKGDAGEEAAARWLKRHKYKIIARNYSCRFGEIDIIAADREYICFVEVKTRAPSSWERPASAVDFNKQRRIITTAQFFLAECPSELQPRFDVVEIIAQCGSVEEINYIENAFEA